MKKNIRLIIIFIIISISLGFFKYIVNAENQTEEKKEISNVISKNETTKNSETKNETATNNETTKEETKNTTKNTQTQKKNKTKTTTNGATAKKSNNANLSNLGMNPNDFKGFKPNQTTYNVTVPNNVEKVTIYATAQDKKATIKGNETKQLNEGKNALSIVVTAEDGTQKTYTINVTRTASTASENTTNENTVNVSSSEITTEAKDNEDIKNIEIKGYSLEPAFSPNIYEYKVNVKSNETKLDITAKTENPNVTIDIAGNENLVDGENTITILCTNEQTKKNLTYQIIVNKSSETEDNAALTANLAKQKAKKVRMILIGLAVAFVAIVLIVIFKSRNNNYEEDEDKYEYDEEDQNKINLSDDEEFFSRINRENWEASNKKSKKETLSDDDMNIGFNNETYFKPYKDISSKEKLEKEETEEYFRTSKSGKKGKHF